MSTDSHYNSSMAGLSALVEKYAAQLVAADEKLAEAQRHRDQIATNLDRAKMLLEYEREQSGIRMGFVSSLYYGLPVREAAIKLLQSEGRPLSKQELIDALVQAGYVFESRYPGRALHAALIGADAVIQDSEGRLALADFKNNANEAARGPHNGAITVGP
jgi:hypothetical protein